MEDFNALYCVGWIKNFKGPPRGAPVAHRCIYCCLLCLFEAHPLTGVWSWKRTSICGIRVLAPHCNGYSILVTRHTLVTPPRPAAQPRPARQYWPYKSFTNPQFAIQVRAGHGRHAGHGQYEQPGHVSGVKHLTAAIHSWTPSLLPAGWLAARNKWTKWLRAKLGKYSINTR